MHSDERDEPETIRCSQTQPIFTLVPLQFGDFTSGLVEILNGRTMQGGGRNTVLAFQGKVFGIETFYFTAQESKIHAHNMTCQRSCILSVPEPPVYCAGKAPVVVPVIFSEPVP